MEQTGVLHERLDLVLARHQRDPTALVQILQDAQRLEGSLPAATITHIARQLGLPRARVEGVVGFYSFLHAEPAGRYRVLFSDNVTDRMAGSLELLERMCAALWVERGRVSEDGLVSVDTTSCTGLCDQGPAILVNGVAIPRMTPERVDRVADLIREQVPVDAWPEALRAIADNVHRADIVLGSDHRPGDAIRAAIARGAARFTERPANAHARHGPTDAGERGSMATLEEIKCSNLRGRGGAGFTTGLKWEACRNALGGARYVVCNADEGEPGTFKDRVLLSRHAELVFDGMTVCAYVVGAAKGFVYLRGEYGYLLPALEARLSRRRADKLLGRAICGQAGFDFDIEIRTGAGAYVCGEESALIESLEGKRGIPRNRPPYPVTHGYRDQPTVVNNVETLCAAALIAIRGGAWYRGIGTAKSSGTKVLAVSGDCPRPGVYEVAFGTTVGEVLALCGARSTQAVQISGPSGVCIDPREFDRRIAFEDLPTAGAFMVFDEGRDMFEVARSFVHFFAHESCGFCTPCRVGTTLLRNAMDKIHDGKGSKADLDRIVRLSRVLQASSHCGLGHTACNPTLDTLKRFRPAYERRLQSPDFEPAFDLDGALARARAMTGRDDAGAHLGGMQ